MKRIAFMIMMILLFTQVFSQETLKITKKDNTVLTIPTSEIISITFSGSEQIADDNAVYDADGNSYNILKIGMQTWTGKNLETTKFKNGDPIPKAGSEAEWEQAGKEEKPAWCYYLDASDNGKKYGILYNWYAVNDERGLAPEGWRVSTASDWDGLKSFLKNNQAEKLKEKGNSNWIKNSDTATNETGFTALPAGQRSALGKFSNVGMETLWWASDTRINSNSAIMIPISDKAPHRNFNHLLGSKSSGYSVRLVKE